MPLIAKRATTQIVPQPTSELRLPLPQQWLAVSGEGLWKQGSVPETQTSLPRRIVSTGTLVAGPLPKIGRQELAQIPWRRPGCLCSGNQASRPQARGVLSCPGRSQRRAPYVVPSICREPKEKSVIWKRLKRGETRVGNQTTGAKALEYTPIKRRQHRFLETCAVAVVEPVHGGSVGSNSSTNGGRRFQRADLSRQRRNRPRSSTSSLWRCLPRFHRSSSVQGTIWVPVASLRAV